MSNPVRMILSEEYQQPGLFVVHMDKFVHLGYASKSIRESVDDLRIVPELIDEEEDLNTSALFVGSFIGMGRIAADLVRKSLQLEKVHGDWYEFEDMNIEHVTDQPCYPFTALNKTFDIRLSNDPLSDLPIVYTTRYVSWKEAEIIRERNKNDDRFKSPREIKEEKELEAVMERVRGKKSVAL